MKKFAFLLFATIFAVQSFADDIRLGTPAYGGTGCPSGSASVALSPDFKSLSILFDNFVAQASARKRMDRKTCNIAIPVHIPNGYSVSVFAIDYRGFNSLPYGAYSQFNVEYFFAGSRGPSYQKTFTGALVDNYTINNSLMGVAATWSPCGQDVNLRVNAGMLVQTNGRGEEAMATVDSMDLKSGIVYHLQWRRC